MDLMDALRGDIEQLRVDPFTRAASAQGAAERAEARQADTRLAESRDRLEDSRAGQAAIERAQIAVRGYSDSELAQVQAQREALRRDQVDEAWATIERLDPEFAAAKRAEAARAAQVRAKETTLNQARSLSNDPFMQRMVAEYDQRQAIQRSRERQAQIAYHEQELIRMGRY